MQRRTLVLLGLALSWILVLTATIPLRGGEGAAPAAPETAAPTKPTTPAASQPAAKAKPEETDLIEDVMETFRRGGNIMWALLATSIVGLTFFLERLVGLRRSAHIPPKLAPEVLTRSKGPGGVEAAERLLKDRAAALARVLSGLLARRDASRQEMERVLEDEAGRILWDLRLNIRPVGIVASIAPLIGLLGTVFGMIAAFQEAAELGMDDPKKFAGGIYEALYTTAFGLTIAIPFLIGYHYLRGKADVIMREVEDIAIRFIIDYHGVGSPTVNAPADPKASES